MHTFEKIASIIIGLIALYWMFTTMGQYFKVRKYLNNYWRSDKFTGAYFHFLGLKIASFKCTSESACVNWGFFLGVVTHALYIGAMWGIVKGIVMYFG